MDEKLNKIDEVVKRTGVSYEAAKKALEEADGDVLEAVILIENKYKNNSDSDARKKGEEILAEIKRVIEMGNATRITVKKNGEVILNLPVTAGAVGAVISPFLAVAGVTAAILTQCTVEIQQADGKVIDVNAKVEKGMDAMKETMSDIKDTVSEGAEDIKNNFRNM